jgi:hypothetical protein
LTHYLDENCSRLNSKITTFPYLFLDDRGSRGLLATFRTPKPETGFQERVPRYGRSYRGSREKVTTICEEAMGAEDVD